MTPKYSKCFIVTIIVKYHNKSQNTSKRLFCKQNNLPKSTLDYWLFKYSNNTLFVKTNVGRPTKITEEIKKIINNYVLKRHNITITQVVNYLKSYKKIVLCRTTIYKIMKLLNFVYKQKSFYTVSKKTSRKETNINIKNKQKEYNDIGLDNIVSIDEVPFYREMVSLKGWCKKGSKLRVLKKSIYSQKFSVVMAITNKKVITYDIIKGSLNGVKYAKFLESNLIPKLNKSMHFLMDNVPFHKTKKVTSLIENIIINHYIVFLIFRN